MTKNRTPNTKLKTTKYKIYTKTGDKGETGIIGGRISKASDLMEVIGNLDELNASLGTIFPSPEMGRVRARPIPRPARFNSWKDQDDTEINVWTLEISKKITQVQNTIFNLGAIVAGSKENFKIDTKSLENDIDEWDKILDPLQNFILPGGTLTSSQIHMSRAICRRLERSIVKIMDSKSIEVENISEILKFINRLSDWLFTLARVVNKKSGVKDVKWSK